MCGVRAGPRFLLRATPLSTARTDCDDRDSCRSKTLKYKGYEYEHYEVCA
jgi:hypothetical protein